MAGTRGVWTYQKQAGGEKCRHENPNRFQKCRRCGKRRPARKPPAHRAALKLSYEEYVTINGGEFCGICKVGRSPTRKLDRDHAHHGEGVPRGLLCHMCNRRLDRQATPAWLRAAADYLERTENVPSQDAIGALC